LAFGRSSRLDLQRRMIPRKELLIAASRGVGTMASLPDAESEIGTVAALSRHPTSLVGRYATKDQIMRRASSATIIHFAGHGVVNRESPFLSALAVPSSSDSADYLYVYEFGGGMLHSSRLFVLTACRTGEALYPGMTIAG